MPQLQPINLDVLEEKAPGQFERSHLRILQRKVKRATEGPALF